MCCIRYYMYRNGCEPEYAFGTDSHGYDLMLRLAGGLRLSLLLAVSVSFINFIIGACYGAIEGFYGGTADLIMERITGCTGQRAFHNRCNIVPDAPFRRGWRDTMLDLRVYTQRLDRLMLCAALVAVYNQGVFTGVMYGLRRMKDIFFPFIKSEYVKYPDYKHKKEAKKIKNYSFLFFTGLLLTIPAIYFMVRFYQIP